MNTSKQVQLMVGLLFVFVIGTLLYFLWDNVRADAAREHQILANAERGGALYATNCRLCHGQMGMGTLENPNYPGPPLNLEANRPDDPSQLRAIQSRFLDVIHCGRIGTLMPPWSADQGGSLNDFQIEQLVTLITGAMPGLDPPKNPNAVSEIAWEHAIEEAEHEDLREGQLLTEPVGPTDTLLVLTDAQGFAPDGLIRIGEEIMRVVAAPGASVLDERVTADQTEIEVARADVLFRAGETLQAGEELMRILSVSDSAVVVERGVNGTEARQHPEGLPVMDPRKDIEVERGAFATEATSHEAGEQIFNGPIEPPDPATSPLTGQDTAVCGQTFTAPPPAEVEPVPAADGDTIAMGDNFFEFGGQVPAALEVPVGQEITLNLVNEGAALHNMHIANPDGTYAVAVCEPGGDEICSDPGAMASGDTGTITFRFDEPGARDFRCDFHPVEMTGQIVIVE